MKVRDVLPAAPGTTKVEVFRLETVSGHEVRATADTIFETPEGPKRTADLVPGDQLFLQAVGGQWNPERALPCAVGTLREWTPDLGALLGRFAAADGFELRVDESGATHLVARFDTQDLGRAVWVRERLTRWFEARCQLVEDDRGHELQGVLSGAVGLAVREQLFSEGRHLPDALFRAPEDVVHAFVRTYLGDRGTFEGRIMRISGPGALLGDVQEVLAYLGTLAIRWADDGEQDEVDLLLPIDTLERLPESARPAGWSHAGSGSEVAGLEQPSVTTILRMHSEGLEEIYACPTGPEVTSLRGILVVAAS